MNGISSGLIGAAHRSTIEGRGKRELVERPTPSLPALEGSAITPNYAPCWGGRRAIDVDGVNPPRSRLNSMPLFLYFLLYFLLAILWRSVVVYRETGSNPP